jgi:hypothetical protein
MADAAEKQSWARVPMLQGSTNYNQWKERAFFALKAAGCSTVINFEDAASPPKFNEVNTSLDNRAHGLICLQVSDSVFEIVKSTKSAHEAWHSLEKWYNRSSIQDQLVCLKNLFRCDQQQSESIENYIARVEAATSRVSASSKSLLTITEPLKCAIILLGASADYQNAVDAIDANSTELSVEKVSAILVRAENRKTDAMANPARTLGADKLNDELLALKAHIEKSSAEKWCSFCKTMVSKCFKSNCFKLHPELKNNKNVRTLAYSATNAINKIYMTGEWLLDSGCNRHINRDHSSMFDLTSEDRVIDIQLGDNHRAQSKQSGSSLINLGGTITEVRDCFHAPNFGKNLLSIGVSTGRGLKFYFDGDTCEIFE